MEDVFLAVGNIEVHTTQTESINCNEGQVSALASNCLPEFLKLIQDFTDQKLTLTLQESRRRRQTYQTEGN